MADGDGVPVRVAGALKGAVRVPSYDATVATLRQEVARLLGLSEAEAAGVKLIAGGRIMTDAQQLAAGYHVGPATRVLVTKGAAAGAGLAGQEAAERSEAARLARLDRLKAAAEQMAARGDGRGLTDQREFSLENQAGSRLSLSEADRKALVLGLALHDKGRATLAAGRVQDALAELLLAEDSFGCVTPSLLEGIDNLAMLLLDIVWCFFKLRDVSRLGVCGERLAAARRQLQAAHGPHQERLRLLHGNFCPEHTTYLRLELLEGVVAHHSGDAPAAAAALRSAHARWQKLQLCEASLLQLAELGFEPRAAARALRFSSGDVAAAVDFLASQQARDEERRQQARQQSAWLKERAKYGKTPGGKYVDCEALERLTPLGYDRGLAAAALRQADNDANTALDVLTDPVRRGALQLALIAQQVLEEEQGPQNVKSQHVTRLKEMGFREKAARQALAAADDSLEGALKRLQVMGDDARELPAGEAGTSAAAAAAAAAAASPGQHSSKRRRRGRARAGAGPSTGGGDGDGDGDGSSSGSEGGEQPQQQQQQQRQSTPVNRVDREMEDELAAVVGKAHDDPLAAYDVDVSEEGEALQAYLALIAGSGAAAAAAAAAAAPGGGA